MSESVISKVGFWQGLVVSAISIAVTLGTIFIAAGGSLARLNQVESDVRELKDKTATKEQVQELKQDVRELKSDVKELIKQNK